MNHSQQIAYDGRLSAIQPLVWSLMRLCFSAFTVRFVHCWTWPHLPSLISCWQNMFFHVHTTPLVTGVSLLLFHGCGSLPSPLWQNICYGQFRWQLKTFLFGINWLQCIMPVCVFVPWKYFLLTYLQMHTKCTCNVLCEYASCTVCMNWCSSSVCSDFVAADEQAGV